MAAFGSWQEDGMARHLVSARRPGLSAERALLGGGHRHEMGRPDDGVIQPACLCQDDCLHGLQVPLDVAHQEVYNPALTHVQLASISAAC